MDDQVRPKTLDPHYRIVSDEAVIVSGRLECWNCGTYIEVICVYCQTGFVDGEPTVDFSVSNVTTVDESLRLQLSRWPSFRATSGRDARAVRLANHCPDCGKVQDDFYLHCQPGGIFFSFQDPGAGELRIHALQGPVRFCGDEGFEP